MSRESPPGIPDSVDLTKILPTKILAENPVLQVLSTPRRSISVTSLGSMDVPKKINRYNPQLSADAQTGSDAKHPVTGRQRPPVRERDYRRGNRGRNW
jgi:hypothetical protein